MNLNIARIDKTLPLPQYHSKGAVAFDLYSRLNYVVEPNNYQIVKTNLIIKVPEDHFLLVASRSSTPIRKGLMVLNGIGVIDQDFHGENDEIGVILYSISKDPVQIEKGERIAQAILVKMGLVDKFIEIDHKGTRSRGGFGSTGK